MDKVFPWQAGTRESNSWNLCNKAMWWRQEDSWSFLVSYPSLLCELQARERLCVNQNSAQCLGRTHMADFWPPHTCTHKYTGTRSHKHKCTRKGEGGRHEYVCVYMCKCLSPRAFAHQLEQRVPESSRQGRPAHSACCSPGGRVGGFSCGTCSVKHPRASAVEQHRRGPYPLKAAAATECPSWLEVNID